MSNKSERQLCLVATHLFLFRSQEVLLARRFQTGYEDGNYSVPAGHVDFGESCTQAMIRETKEEINIALSPEKLTVAHVVHRSAEDSGPWINLFMTYEWEPGLGEPQNNEPHKCDDLLWVHATEFPENVVPYVRHAFENVLAGATYSEFGW